MARSFNGTSDLITIDAVTAISTTSDAWTWAGWVKGAAQSTKAFVSQCANATNPQMYFGTDSSTPFNNCRFLLVDVGGVTRVNMLISTATVMDSTPHHVAVTWDSSANWVVYVDGVNDHSGSTSSAVSIGTTRATFGCFRRSTNSDFLNGSLWDWARWSRALSAKEILSLANGLPPSHLGPDHYWPLWGLDSPEPDIGNG